MIEKKVIGKKINELSVGDSDSFTKTITDSDVRAFGEVSGDMNPAHFDNEYASKTIFKKRIAHGMLCASLFSTILGTKLPWYGTIYLSQEVKFLAPVYLNDKLTATATVKEILEKNRVIMETITVNQDGVIVIKGSAVVMPPR